MRQGVPFSSKIRRLLALFGLVAFAVVFAVNALYESRKFKAELSGIMQALAAESGSLLHESIVQHRRAINEILAAVPTGDEAAVCRYFTENLPLLGPEDCYFILNSAGVVVHASRRASDFVGLDFSHLPYLHTKEEISGVHQSLATLKPVVTLTYPLPAGWVMLVERDLFSLAPLVGHLKLAGLVEEGFFFVLSDSGTVVYHPDERLVANRHPLGFDLREWSEADASGLREYTYRGKRYLCLCQPLAAPRGWVFYAAVPRQEFLRFVGIHLVYQAMAIAVLFGVLGGLLHILIDRKVSRPIQCLAAHLSTFNPLQDSAVSDPVAGENAAELNQIVAACERMAANIRAANEQLRGNEALFRTVTEFASDWSYWLDPEEKVVYVSPSCELITGYTAAEFYAEPALMQKLVHPEDREPVLAHVHHAVQQDHPHPMLEFRIVAKDGTVRWLSHICRPIRDAEGNFLGVRGSNTDISERKQAEFAMQESEARFRSLVEQASDGIFLHDLEGTIIEVNPSGCRMLGYSREQLLRMKVSDLEAVMETPHLKTLWESLAAGQGKIVQGKVRRHDGTILLIEVQHSLVQWGGRQLVMAITRDISERQRAAVALAAEKELLAVTLRSIGDGVVTADVEGRVLLLSRTAEKLTGWREEEARGRRLDEVLRLVDQKTREPRESPLAKVLATGQLVMLTENTLLIAKDGSERLVADSGAPIFDRDSQVIGAVVVFRDITEQHRLEQELYKAHKLESLGVLAGGIAHDFNNLLTAIIGNLSMARSDAPGEAMRRQLKAAEKAASRAQGLTQQLLTFAKGGAPIKAVASIADLVREAAEFSLHGTKTRYTMTSPPDLWVVEVDAAQMSQVVNNLILNADQAMPGGGTIAISLTNRHLDAGAGLPLSPGPYVEIRVADQGHGIAPDHLERIFDPYFSTKQTGSGLGLASSYSIIKRHGGHIAAESRPGEGAVFTVYLPAQPDQAVAEPTGESGQILPGQGRVLVLDDEEMVRELALAVLKRLGYEADCAEEGGQALSMYQMAQAAGRPYDVVIMDLTIPGGMGGQEAIKELLRLDPLARAIVSSGYAQDPVMANYRDYGFAAVLAKPYSVEALSRVLHDILVGSCAE